MLEPDPASDCAVPGPGKPRSCASLETDPFDDMHDSEAEWQKYSALLPLQSCCRIADAFDRADKQALKFQKRHRLITNVAAVVATLAVVLAVGGLGYMAASDLNRQLHSGAPARPLGWEETLDWMELAAAGTTVSIVGVGYFFGWKNKWLLFRHRAELYRLLRYNFLIQPSLWSDQRHADFWIGSRLQQIEGLTQEGALEKALNEPSPPGPYPSTGATIARGQLQALTEYYLAKRLGPQKEYLANRVQRNEIKDWVRMVLPWFFFGSIVAVVAKFFLKGPHPWWGFSLILAATLLPVFAAGFRTYLAAFEFSRNKGRFHAAHKALLETEKSLMTNTFAALSAEPAQPRHEAVIMTSHLAQVIVMAEQPGGAESEAQAQTDAYPVLRDLAWSEHILDAEHREWLRLMYDAEWFG